MDNLRSQEGNGQVMREIYAAKLKFKSILTKWPADITLHLVTSKMKRLKTRNFPSGEEIVESHPFTHIKQLPPRGKQDLGGSVPACGHVLR